MAFSDIVFLLTGVFGFMLTVVIVYPIFSQFMTQFQNASSSQASAIQNAQTKVEEGISAYDAAIPVFTVLLALVSIAAAATIRAHPAFFIFMLFVNIAFLIGADVFNRIYTDAAAQEPSGTAFLTWTPLFLDNAPKISVVLMVVMAFVMYARGEG